jgi:plasmid stabilization system protein ParE
LPARRRATKKLALGDAVVISPAAERDLEDIWLTIAADNPAAATRIVRAIGMKIGRLVGSYPFAETQVPDPTRGLESLWSDLLATS